MGVRSGVGVPPVSFRGNEVTAGIQPLGAIHQADNLAKLRQEFLSMLKLIAKIFCAVEIARTSEALGNAQPRAAVAYA